MSDLLLLLSEQEPWAQAIIGLSVLILIATAVNFVIRHVILRAVTNAIQRKSKALTSAASWLATVVPLLIMSRWIVLVPFLPGGVYTFVSQGARALIILSVAMAIVKTLTYLNNAYERRPESRNRPIKGFVQLLKILVLSIAAILMIAALIDQSPLLLFSGLGAITAVLLLVFKDTILSLVASVQLSTGDMLRVGDWIEMPSMNADGDVTDISLHTVTVQNFDKTIAYVPTHRLVSDSYRNWRGMSESGGRRIKRSLVIDQNTIRFLGEEEIVDLKKFKMLKEYLAAKADEIAQWNARELSGDDAPINARRLTNIGTLRAYIVAYLKWHPRIGEGFTLLVRQLEPTPLGLPIEIYCFTDTTNWGEYEAIQADIFDHLMAIIPEFGLRVFQEPSGLDVREAPPALGGS